tara:strand:- start:1622 stop:1927 length:306 start_codon:yes stop_codon:yes gene_type:complete
MTSLLFAKPLPRCRVIVSAKKEDNAERRRVFREKISDSRKQSLGDIGKHIKSVVKQEVSETRAIFDDHVKFFKQNPKTKKTKKSNKPEPKEIEVIDAEFFE